MAVSTIHVEAWQVAYRNLLPASLLDGLNVEERTQSWTEWIKRSLSGSPTDGDAPLQRLIVAECAGDIVGWATFGGGRDVGTEQQGELAGLYVHPQHWGGGFGFELLQRAEQELTIAGFVDQFLWVMAGNARAMSFYERHGWRADGQQKLFVLGRDAEVEGLRYVRQ
ncbi:GNAT family N-acetyltransferase [Microcella sp.]|uniref:GNAT family N-acetyltransferase n=1 Tax=Microcella sp. TaxID=1913979 RepID=UPI00299F7E69|nr:GNAT family N-acetyltransferase [Microcella sp.]